LLRSYRVPDAARFRTAFCEQCGSPMPRIYEDSGIAVIPAGSLDHEPPLVPTDRIMWSSRTAWSCDSGEIPKWPEYPG
jgi:hypothetical protein